MAASTDIEASITQISALENHGVAVLAITRGRIDLQNAWIADTAADGTPGGPGRAVTAQDGGLMTILGLVAQRSRQAGILVAAGGASLALRSSRIEDVAAGDDEALGHGLTALEGSSLVVDDVTVRRCAAVGLVFDAASGTVRASRITDNAVGIFAQGGSELLQVAVVPEAPVDRQVSISTGSGAKMSSVSSCGSSLLTIAILLLGARADTRHELTRSLEPLRVPTRSSCTARRR